MQVGGTASFDARRRSAYLQGDCEVLWLRPRTHAAPDVRRGAPALRSFRRLITSLCAGIAFNLWMGGIAFAPSALALGNNGSTASSIEAASQTADVPDTTPAKLMGG